MSNDEPTCIINHNGTKEWRLNGKLHRVDGPAVEYNGSASVFIMATKWYLNGKIHRVDGPALEWSDGTKEWYINGRHHRIDGPAIEYGNGEKEWYINGEEVDPIVHFVHIPKSEKE